MKQPIASNILIKPTYSTKYLFNVPMWHVCHKENWAQLVTVVFWAPALQSGGIVVVVQRM
jgi:hypothetical protein